MLFLFIIQRHFFSSRRAREPRGRSAHAAIPTVRFTVSFGHVFFLEFCVFPRIAPASINGSRLLVHYIAVLTIDLFASIPFTI